MPRAGCGHGSPVPSPTLDGPRDSRGVHVGDIQRGTCETTESIARQLLAESSPVAPELWWATTSSFPDRSRLAAVDRLTASVTAQTSARPCAGPWVCCSRPLVTPDFVTGHPIEGTAPVAAATNVSNVPDSLPHVVRTARPSTLHWHKRHRGFPRSHLCPIRTTTGRRTTPTTTTTRRNPWSITTIRMCRSSPGSRRSAPDLIHLCRTLGACTATLLFTLPGAASPSLLTRRAYPRVDRPSGSPGGRLLSTVRHARTPSHTALPRRRSHSCDEAGLVDPGGAEITCLTDVKWRVTGAYSGIRPCQVVKPVV